MRLVRLVRPTWAGCLPPGVKEWRGVRDWRLCITQAIMTNYACVEQRLWLVQLSLGWTLGPNPTQTFLDACSWPPRGSVRMIPWSMHQVNSIFFAGPHLKSFDIVIQPLFACLYCFQRGDHNFLGQNSSIVYSHLTTLDNLLECSFWECAGALRTHFMWLFDRWSLLLLLTVCMRCCKC